MTHKLLTRLSAVRLSSQWSGPASTSSKLFGKQLLFGVKLNHLVNLSRHPFRDYARHVVLVKHVLRKQNPVEKLVVWSRPLEELVVFIGCSAGVYPEKVAQTAELTQSFPNNFLKLLSDTSIESVSKGVTLRVSLKEKVDVLEGLRGGCNCVWVILLLLDPRLGG